MATAAAEACLQKGLKLAPVAMTGPELELVTIVVFNHISEKSSEVKLIPSSNKDELIASISGLKTSCGKCTLGDRLHTSIGGQFQCGILC